MAAVRVTACSDARDCPFKPRTSLSDLIAGDSLWILSGARLFEGGLARLISVHQRKKEAPKGLL